LTGFKGSDTLRAMFEPLHVQRSHGFRIDMPPARAFELFTPRGERAWVPGWDPEFLHPADGSLRRGTTFLTQDEGERSRTIWLVTDLDLEHLRVSYARITPTSRAGHVDVEVATDPEGGSRVQVSYAFTALTEAGNAYLADFTDEYYRAYIESWRDLIESIMR
jgi:hypothetical protein